MPRKPTEKQTPEERAEKNRRNSSSSCGPKTAFGKSKVSRNSYKHGFRASTIVATVDDAEALRELSQEWNSRYQPRTPAKRAALDRCVYYTRQFQRIAAAETAALAEQVHDAGLAWERDQLAKVAAHRAELIECPEKAVDGLNETAAGCRWLISEWDILRSALDADGCWYAKSHRDQATRLQGLRPEETSHEDVYWLCLMNLCAGDEPDPQTLSWYMERANMPDTLRRGLQHGPPPREFCEEELRARVDEELTLLRAREEFLRVKVEEPSRRGAPNRKLVVEGAVGARLVQYMRMNDTAYNRNLKQLEKADEGDEGIVAESGEPTTCNVCRAAAAEHIAEETRKVEEYRAEATNKANVPGFEATNKANVPDPVATGKANSPDRSWLNNAELESSSEWDPEVSPMQALAKSLAIHEERRKAAQAVSPVDQGNSNERGAVAPAHGAGLPPEGGGGGAPSSRFHPGG